MFGIQTNFRTGQAGKNGWSPVFAVAIITANLHVLQLVDYTGGTGAKPTANINDFLGANGYVADAANATNIKGVAGDNGVNGWSPIFVVGIANDTWHSLKLVDYAGGTGTKPTLHIGEYLGTNGYVTDIKDAVNIKGDKGVAGFNGWIPRLEPVYRTPTEVVMQVTDYYGGTGPNPYDNVDPLLTFVGFAGELVSLAQAKRINPEDSFANRIANIRDKAINAGFAMGTFIQILALARNGFMEWATNNVTNPDFTQMDAMTLFKSAFRTVAYYINYDRNTATELSTLPVSVVAPELLGEIDLQMSNWSDVQLPIGLDLSRQVLRAVIDFDGELEAQFLLGDISDTTTPADLNRLQAAWDYVLSGLS